MLSDAQSYVRVQNIFNPENFDRSLIGSAEFIQEHAEKYSAMPTFDQINAVSRNKMMAVEVEESQQSWFLDEFEKFTQRKELERAILHSADLLEKGDFSPVEKLIRDAVQISLTRDLGTDYFADPKSRLSELKAGNGQVSTGWNGLDRKLFGGMNRGELNIFAGGSGSGKSLFMQNLSLNWLQQGLNGVYITLELSEELSAMRIDGMVTGFPSRDVFKKVEEVELKVKMAAKKCGQFRLKYLPAQSNVNDIRAYLKELQIQTGLKADFIMIDYLDLLMPVSAKVSPNDQFIKDKYVSEELRNLAREMDLLLVTASQLNRSAVEEIEFDHSHIAGGISKINTADNVFGIYTSRSMREKGRYQLQLLKTRSSSGVGQRVDLEFDIDTLRILDCEQEEASSSGSEIMQKIKENRQSSADTPAPAPKIETSSSKVKALLNNLNKD